MYLQQSVGQCASTEIHCREHASLQGLEKVLEEREKEFEGAPLGRLFYLALPPSVYPQVHMLFRDRHLFHLHAWPVLICWLSSYV